MRVIFKINKDKFPFEIASTDLISSIKQQISSKIDIPPSNFHLISGIENNSILLTDSFQLSFFQLSENSIIEISPYGTQNLSSKKFKRAWSYLESLGLDESLPSRDSDPLQVAIEACKRGSLKELMRIIEIYEETNPGEEDIMNQSHPNLWRPLHYASFYGHSEIITYLVSRNVNVNRVTVDEWTALQLACYQGHISCIKELLIHENLQINKMTKFRGTGLHLACEISNFEIVTLLLQNGALVSLKDPNDHSMFEKTTDERILQALAVSMGQEQLKKHNFEAPISKIAEVWISTNMSIHGRPVVLHLDTQNRLLSRYPSMASINSKSDAEYTIKLYDIQSVVYEEIKSTHEYYFIIESSRGTDRYYTNNKKTTNEWISFLKNATNFFMNEANPKDLETTKPVKSNEEAVENHMVNADNDIGEVVNFDSFELLEELGQGSFGVVYKARKKTSSEVFAMKCLSKAKLRKQRQLKYAISECKIMKILKHPFVLQMFYAFQTPQSLYLVIEYCPNGDLLKLVHKNSKVSEDIVRFYAAEIVLALEYLASLDIVYRDLKPENVLIDNEGHAKLADFGLAKEDITNNPAMTMAGSPAYLPPEIVKHKGASAASDIYGIGVMIYEMLTGSLPHYNEDIELLYNSIVKDQIAIPGFVSSEAKDLMKSLMHKKPEKRLNFSQIKKHSFFKKIDWEALLEKQIPVPTN